MRIPKILGEIVNGGMLAATIYYGLTLLFDVDPAKINLFKILWMVLAVKFCRMTGQLCTAIIHRDLTRNIIDKQLKAHIKSRYVR